MTVQVQDSIKILLILVLIFISQYCSGDKIKKNEVGGACSTSGRE